MRPLLCCLVWSIHFTLASGATAEDWPTHGHDAGRSAYSRASLPRKLQLAWTYRTPVPPLPAWDEPATWDGWHKVRGLKNRQVFDKALAVSVVNGRVFFGSSVDDHVHCLDATQGTPLWSAATDGPVRLAPTVADGHVFAGSDDGYAYCWQVADGTLRWRHRLGPSDRRLPGNGRLISPWAIRSSVAVADNTCYLAAGVLPVETVYVAALEASTGRELWKTEMRDRTAQGYLLASDTRLFVTTGRDRPLVFDRTTGQRLFQLQGGGGGTYALLADDMLVYGPGKTGEIAAFGPARQAQLASFGGNHVVFTPARFLLHTDRGLSAVDRAEYFRILALRAEAQREQAALQQQLKQAEAEAAGPLQQQLADREAALVDLQRQLEASVVWEVACDCPAALIVAGDRAYTGGRDRVVAWDMDSGEEQWRARVDGTAWSLAAAGGQLYVSTDRGAIHCFSAEGTATDAVAPPEQGADLAAAAVEPTDSALHGPDPHGIVDGPFVEFVDPTTVEVSWSTREATEGQLGIGRPGRPPQMVDTAANGAATQHRAAVSGLPAREDYQLWIHSRRADGSVIETPRYGFDATLNYAPRTLALQASTDSPAASLCQQMLDTCGTERGFALVLGVGSGDLIRELVRRSELRLIVVEPDASLAAKARTEFLRAGIAGWRVSVQQRAFNDLPYGPYFANLVTSEAMLADGKFRGQFATLYRLLRPAGGTLYLGTSTTAEGDRQHKAELTRWAQRDVDTDAPEEWHSGPPGFHFLRRGKLPGSGEWTHQYALANNASCSQDARIRGPLSVLWWGRPGARPMPDRGPRNPAPVSAAGRLYVQGNRTLFGLDAYNGTMLWSLQIPTMRRANLPRDCSNMVTTDTSLYLAIGDACLELEGQTGQRRRQFTVPPDIEGGLDAGEQREAAHDWGYLGVADELLLGSRGRRGAVYQGDQGEWYEDFKPELVSRVTSDALFAFERTTGDQRWQYANGTILNSTVAVEGRRVFFVESRNPEIEQTTSARLLEPILKDQHLVALDLDTGDVVWDQPYDFSGCQFTTYLVVGGGRIVVTGADPQKVFHTFAFDPATGEPIWQHEVADKKGHHSGQLDHPTIVANRLYLNKHTYDVATGKVLDVHNFNWHGCGVVSASLHTLFRRYEFHAMQDIETGERTEFVGVRPGCWLGMIPSGGVLLAPESGAGCFCTHTLQTSMAYVPSAALGPPEESAGAQ